MDNQVASNDNQGRAKRFALTILTTGIATLISVCINFLLTPFITEKLGTEAYGFITLANTIVSYVMIVMTALNSFATRYIAVEYHQGNKHEASVYYSSLFYANAVISVALFLILLPVALYADHIFNVPISLVDDVKYLFVLVFANFLVTTASSSFSASAYIKNRLDIYGVFQSLSYILEAAILLIAYSLFTPHLWYFGVAVLCAGLVILVGNIFLFRRYTPELVISRQLYSFAAVKELLSVGIWSSINSLGNVLNNGLDMVVSNILVDALAMGQLAIARTFSTIFSRLYQLVSQAFYPNILKFYSESRIDDLLFQFKLAMKFTGAIASVLFGLCFALCPAFYELWIPGQDIDMIYRLTIAVMLYSLFEGPIQPLYYVYALTLKNRIPTIITLVGGILNVLIMIPILMYTDVGVIAIPSVTAGVMFVISFVTNPLYMAHCLKVKKTTFYPTIVRVMVATVVCCTVFSFAQVFLDASNWLTLVVDGVICALVGLVVYSLIVIDRSELQAIKVWIRARRMKDAA